MYCARYQWGIYQWGIWVKIFSLNQFSSGSVYRNKHYTEQDGYVVSCCVLFFTGPRPNKSKRPIFLFTCWYIHTPHTNVIEGILYIKMHCIAVFKERIHVNSPVLKTSFFIQNGRRDLVKYRDISRVRLMNNFAQRWCASFIYTFLFAWIL